MHRMIDNNMFPVLEKKLVVIERKSFNLKRKKREKNLEMIEIFRCA